MPKGVYSRTGHGEPGDQTPASAKRIRLTHPHGFFDENGRHRWWNAGDVVTDQHEVDLLVARKAMFVVEG